MANNKKADKLIIDYYKGKYSLDILHSKLLSLFGSIRSAVIYLAENDERIKRGVLNVN